MRESKAKPRWQLPQLIVTADESAVRFAYIDSSTKERRECTLSVEEFMRRYLGQSKKTNEEHVKQRTRQVLRGCCPKDIRDTRALMSPRFDYSSEEDAKN